MLGLLLVFKVPIFGHCLPFLGYNNGKKDPNTCFPIYVDVTWPIKAFPFGLVESKAGLPCLAFFGQKRAIFVPFLGVANERKGPYTCFPIYVDVIWPIKAFPFGLVESKAGLPCLAFLVKKGTFLGHFLPFLGVAKE